MATKIVPAAPVLKVEADSTVKFRGRLKEIDLAHFTCQIYVSDTEYVTGAFDDEFESLVRLALGREVEAAGDATSLRRNGKGFTVREVRLKELDVLPDMESSSSLLQPLLEQTSEAGSELDKGWAEREDLNSLEEIINYARQLRGKPALAKE